MNRDEPEKQIEYEKNIEAKLIQKISESDGDTERKFLATHLKSEQTLAVIKFKNREQKSFPVFELFDVVSMVIHPSDSRLSRSAAS